MKRIDSFLGKTWMEKATVILLLLFGTAVFVMTFMHWRFGSFDKLLIDSLQRVNSALLYVFLISRFAANWKASKAREKARLLKERKDVAKAEVVLSGQLHDWK